MSKDAQGQPLSLDEAVRQVQELPEFFAYRLLTWAVEQGLPTLEITPGQPTCQVRAKGHNAVATYGDLKGELYQQVVRDLKKCAGLDPDEVGSAQTATFDLKRTTKGRMQFTLKVEPAPAVESVRVEIQPVAE